MTLTVQQDEGFKFVVHEGLRYVSEDFPPEGTEIEISPYEGFNGPEADFTWSWDSPSGQGFARVKAD
jgi:hypothetical protein